MVAVLKKALAVIGILSLTACSGPALLNATVPSSGYNVVKDVAYGTNERQKLDIYIPSQQDTKKTVIVFFYGGSWQYGSKDDYLFIGQAFAELGYVTVIADYRLYPEVSFPAFIDDGAAAVAWTHKHIGEYNADPGRVFVSGHSAGAYIAGMLAANPEYLTQAGGKRDWIKGFIGIATPANFLPLTDANLIKLFSTAEKPEDTQPITFAGKGMPPTLLLHGTADEDVWLHNSVTLSDRLLAAGSDVTLKTYDDVGHIGIILSAAKYWRWKAPLLEDIKEFTASH